MTKRFFGTIGGKTIAALLSLLVLLSLLSGCVLATGLHAPLMENQFRRYGRLAQVEDEAYAAIAREVTDYLAGSRDDLPTFQPHEQAHMVDVRNIFRFLMVLAAPGVPALLLLWLGRRQGTLRVYWITSVSFLIFAALLGIWGAVDFDSLFVLFHLVAFTNNLWILNPATDLMIQLMPTAFFVDYAARIALTFALAALALLIIAALLHRRYRHDLS